MSWSVFVASSSCQKNSTITRESCSKSMSNFWRTVITKLLTNFWERIDYKTDVVYFLYNSYIVEKKWQQPQNLHYFAKFTNLWNENYRKGICHVVQKTRSVFGKKTILSCSLQQIWARKDLKKNCKIREFFKKGYYQEKVHYREKSKNFQRKGKVKSLLYMFYKF